VGKEAAVVNKLKPSSVVPVFIAGVISFVLWANADSTTPPADPTGSIATTLDANETCIPIRQSDIPANGTLVIDVPGSYCVREDLEGSIELIRIEADNVSIDLGGHVVSGRVVAYGGSYHSVKNGFIGTGNRDGHVQLGDRSEVSDVASFGSANSFAIWVGDDSRVTRCYTAGPEDEGIRTGDRCVIFECIFQGSGGGGLVAGNQCVIKDCSFEDGNNYGIFCRDNCVIINCAIGNKEPVPSAVLASVDTPNPPLGIKAGRGCTITGCVVKGTDDGILAGDDCIIRNCSVFHFAYQGIVTGDGSVVTHCTASFSNQGDGIAVGKGSRLADCTASFNNFGFGIFADEGSSITGCTANANERAGIQVSDRCIVTGNLCDGNGSMASPGRGDSAGILATGTGNRIESNNVTRNDRGIDVIGTQNLIIKNSASANGTNYAIVDGNSYGPIIDVAGIGEIKGSKKTDNFLVNLGF
jgi:parallel beta-helix repeat protein